MGLTIENRLFTTLYDRFIGKKEHKPLQEETSDSWRNEPEWSAAYKRGKEKYEQRECATEDIT